jgi:hypothetical protein
VNAETTARRVLEWASVPAASTLPSGPLRSASALADPAAPTVAALAELVRCACARTGTGSPPFDDPSPLGLGAILLAAAIGGRAQPAPARLLAEALPPRHPGATGWADLLARHAVLAPALAQLRGIAPNGAEEPLAETFLRCSPLTALLYRPPAAALAAGATAAAVAAARALMTRPRGVDFLQSNLSRFDTDPTVLAWRTELLTRLVPDHPEFVVDTYVAARLRYGTEWDEGIARARRGLNQLGDPDELSFATLRYWLPLSRLLRAHHELMRGRSLVKGYQEVIRIVEGRHRLSIAGTS